ncbi:MAG: hypothetical protein RL630_1868 [Verrucomicrobiota bacterium]
MASADISHFHFAALGESSARIPPALNLIESFISRWAHSGAAERANYQMFLSELCDLLEVPRPDPTSPDPEKNLFVFDRAITRMAPDGTSVTNYIDCYKAAHFVLETKQGVGEADAANAAKSGHGRRGSAAFDKALERAYHQGRDYITHLPNGHTRPPFLIVCDVGHSIDLYAEFTCTGGRYERFPDPKNHRILLTDLHRSEVRERLRLVFTDPHALDPSKKAAEVTRDIATRLAKLAKSLEADGHEPQAIAGFLQRCLFTMFAEDIGLLPDGGFQQLLDRVKSTPQGFPVLISSLWKEMATGTDYSTLLFQKIAHFSGGLFEDTSALPLSAAQIAMLADASATDWANVEPSIFGTLLTRALDPRERHKLGAEYTPRSYVERLIRPTIIEPLREEWESTRLAAANLHREAETALEAAEVGEDEAKKLLAAGDSEAAKSSGAAAQKLRAVAKKHDAEALQLVTDFHRRLCALRILDPACGTANFLYVTLEHLKRLEAEVLELATALGGDATFEMKEYRVRPEQFLGLEISPNAVAIAQLVLWIGYFQWQRKTTGKADTGDRPLLPKTPSIRQQDAVLAYDERIPRKNPDTGEILTIWDGHTTKPHPVTGKEIPDESARIPLFDYTNPRRAEWPQADHIVGNPPFLGASRMRDALGDGYTEALRAAWKGAVPESADLVMFWWSKAAAETAQGRCQRFGFITTNSIHQTFNRRVLEPFLADAKNPLHLAYAIPDHPWIDSADGAAVRIAMTVAAPGKAEGILEKVTAERPMEHGECEVTLSRSGGVLAPNLQLGSDLTSCSRLIANDNLSNNGVILGGKEFQITEEKAFELGLENRPLGKKHIRRYMGGHSLTSRYEQSYVLDLFGLTERDVQEFLPEVFQWVYTLIRPKRLENKRKTRRDNWWLFNESVPKLRAMLAGLPRFIGTTETAKHRIFSFVDGSVLPDHMVISIASADAFHLGVLSSSIHITWALGAGGRLGLGNDPRYNKTKCFDPFPFPALEEGPLKQRIRELGERLDAHRKRQQELHPDLTLTGLYNVLEKLRAGDALNAKEKTIHDQGLVTLLRQIHDELDAAVLEAYGWADLHPLTPEREPELLTRLVALNHARAAEEKTGHIRWLRPDYQSPGATAAPQPIQAHLAVTETAPKTENSKPETLAWPDRLPDQVTLLRQFLATDPTASAENLSARFGRKSPKRTEQIAGILETLRGLGHV